MHLFNVRSNTSVLRTAKRNELVVPWECNVPEVKRPLLCQSCKKNSKKSMAIGKPGRE